MNIKIQSISDIITNSSSEVFMIYTKEGIQDFKDIISTLIEEPFDNVFILHIDLPDEDSYEYEQYLEEKESYESFEDWCWLNDSDEEYPYIRGFWVEAIDPEDDRRAKMINKIYHLFEMEERYC